MNRLGERRPSVVGIGEILWDCFPDRKQLGGAPANFAWHCRQIGLKASVVSAVGNDDMGKEALRILEKGGVQCGGVSVLGDYPTGRVDVIVDDAGKPDYRFADHTAWDHLAWNEHAREILSTADCLCFGTLAQRSGPGEQFLQDCLEQASAQTLALFDVNLRQNFYTPEILEKGLLAADIVKLNDEELPVLAAHAGVSCQGAAERILSSLCDQYQLQGIALTCGSKGAALFLQGAYVTAEARKIEVVDTVGAGDAFTAVLSLGLLNGLPPQKMLAAAVHYSGLVCEQSGGMPCFAPSIVNRALDL